MSPRASTHELETLENRLCFSNFAPVFTPTSFAATALTSKSVKLTWVDQAVNEVRYSISRSTDGVTYRQIIRAPMGSVSFVDDNLMPATTYFYKIRAEGMRDNSTSTQAATGTTLSTAADAFARLDDATGTLTIRGTFDDDTISVTQALDVITATRAGIIRTFNSTDVKRINIYAIEGDDHVSIGAGLVPVYVSGGDGDDIILGNDGNDRLDGGAGNDLIKGAAGNDTITGGDGNDTLYGQAGNDSIRGNNGNDKLVGGDGNDFLFGDAGNDRLYGEAGADVLDGGGGANFLRQG